MKTRIPRGNTSTNSATALCKGQVGRQDVDTWTCWIPLPRRITTVTDSWIYMLASRKIPWWVSDRLVFEDYYKTRNTSFQFREIRISFQHTFICSGSKLLLVYKIEIIYNINYACTIIYYQFEHAWSPSCIPWKYFVGT